MYLIDALRLSGGLPEALRMAEEAARVPEHDEQPRADVGGVLEASELVVGA